MDLGEPPDIPEYRLRLDVDFAGQRWTGSVTFEPPTGTTALTLDSEALTVSRVWAGDQPLEFRLESDPGRLVLPVLRPGPITIEFQGTVEGTVLLGLYRSRRADGYVLTSQGEPNGTHRIFPCLDRPDRKSRIALTVRTAPDLVVISNGREESVRDVDGMREWSFAPTPRMPPYLFYLGIGRFDRIEETRGRVGLSVFTPPGQAESGRFALESLVRILAAYEEYFGIPYPLPKLDLVAVAESSFGAMENWGAITFRDTRLLIDERSPSFARRDVFDTISHEVAHQWIGDLVTMTSWTDIWLNESLAAFLETKISQRTDPALDSRADFFLRVAGTGAALEGDSLDATHPVRAPVDRPEEVSQIFDEISYGKGATLFAMLEAYLGEDRFRHGLAAYLRRFAYSNATTADLWEALSRDTGEPVAALIDPWLDRAGLPSISARLVGSDLELSQRRFSYHGGNGSNPWPIPMVIDVDGHSERIRFDTHSRRIPVPPGATVHLNPGALGFYRVRYEPPLHDRLLRALPARPETDRWTFLEDLGAYLASGEVDWPTYAAAVRALGQTSDRLVVEVLCSALGSLAIFHPGCVPVEGLAQWFFASQYDRLGPDRIPGENPSDGVLRERVSVGRTRIDLPFARELSTRFRDWERVEPDLRPAVAVARARAGGATGYRDLMGVLGRAQSERDQLPLEMALAWSNDVALVRETLDRASSGVVNRGIVHMVLHQAASNPVGRAIVWPWLTAHLPRLEDLFRGAGLLSSGLEAVIPILGLGRGDEVREFFRTHPVPEGARGVAKGLERLAIFERQAAVFARLTA